MIRLFSRVAALLLALSLCAPVLAQTADTGSETVAAPSVPEDLTPEMVDGLVARLSDDQVRALLLDRLDAVAAERAEVVTENEGLIARIGAIGTALLANWTAALAAVPTLFAKLGESFANFGSTFGGSGLLRLFGLTALILAVGYAAERLAVYLTRDWHTRAKPADDSDLRGALRFLFRRLCREVLGLIVFWVVLRVVGRQILSAQEIAYAAPFVFYLILLPRLGAAISRFILAPKQPSIRLVSIDDHWASYLHRNQIGLFFLIGFTLWILGFNALNGVPPGEMRLGFWLNTSIHVYIGIIAWTARDGLRDMMRGRDPDRTEWDEKVAYSYPYFALVVTALTWLLVETLIGMGNPQTLQLLALKAPHFTTMFWLLMAPAIDTLIRGLVRHLQPPMIGTGPVAERAYKSTKRSYIRIGRVIAGVFVILMIANAWEIDLRNVAGAGTESGGAVIQALMILAFGYILNEVVSLWINRRLAKEQTAAQTQDEEAGEGGGAGGSRLATVLPLLRITAQVAIAVIFTLLALGALGLDITPLLAGAGILGLAIGFGAQKLVSDIVGGIFFLIDDAFRVGEYVDVGGTMGTVEKISIRSMQLRHHRGAVHTIPYGEIQKLTNYSRDWVIMKLKFTVPFDTDPNKVKKIFKKIGAEMIEDPVHKDGFLQPFKSQGVFDFDDVGMIIRGKFMAKPGTQFTIRKEIYNRVKNAFNEAGIDFARREVRVAIPGLEDAESLSDEQKAAAAGGAAASQQQQG
ncbi:Small-conductance mechanosensitive channel [Cribrihabitans marinus]|uniref:Small-conductance mechanosensitive channel n=1 Tax=Cribrihabitans marinus TaxID=1227549 RepID=A0A1H6VRY3_9RHOB|nr:mechanosensitive ion channel domain-containing protein [Cribrihabitans marinus]GGH25654.1 hypothetical protein GCM10010973_12950 [Cribrihabitans marinus]SEJ04567.1 Small-conductance mechanosensitive channel [Cribrihabitans marinus]